MSKFIQAGTGVVVSVADEKDHRFAVGWTRFDGDAPPVPAAPKPQSGTGSPDASWTIADLRSHAERNSIDLGKATKKDDILAAIAAGPSASTEPAPAGADTEASSDAS